MILFPDRGDLPRDSLNHVRLYHDDIPLALPPRVCILVGVGRRKSLESSMKLFDADAAPYLGKRVSRCSRLGTERSAGTSARDRRCRRGSEATGAGLAPAGHPPLPRPLHFHLRRERPRGRSRDTSSLSSDSSTPRSVRSAFTARSLFRFYCSASCDRSRARTCSQSSDRSQISRQARSLDFAR